MSSDDNSDPTLSAGSEAGEDSAPNSQSQSLSKNPNKRVEQGPWSVPKRRFGSKLRGQPSSTGGSQKLIDKWAIDDDDEALPPRQGLATMRRGGATAGSGSGVTKGKGEGKAKGTGTGTGTGTGKGKAKGKGKSAVKAESENDDISSSADKPKKVKSKSKAKAKAKKRKSLIFNKDPDAMSTPSHSPTPSPVSSPASSPAPSPVSSPPPLPLPTKAKAKANAKPPTPELSLSSSPSPVSPHSSQSSRVLSLALPESFPQTSKAGRHKASASSAKTGKESAVPQGDWADFDLEQGQEPGQEQEEEEQEWSPPAARPAPARAAPFPVLASSFSSSSATVKVKATKSAGRKPLQLLNKNVSVAQQQRRAAQAQDPQKEVEEVEEDEEEEAEQRGKVQKLRPGQRQGRLTINKLDTLAAVGAKRRSWAAQDDSELGVENLIEIPRVGSAANDRRVKSRPAKEAAALGEEGEEEEEWEMPATARHVQSGMQFIPLRGN